MTAADLIHPLFIDARDSTRREVPSMPGVFNLGMDHLDREIDELTAAGVRAVLLFGVPEAATKDATGSGASHPAGPVPRAIARLKSRAPHIAVFADVCLCEYTDHGRCGLPDLAAPDDPGAVLNDATLPHLARAALAYARAGADMVAPSDMMDGRIGHIRRALDGAGFGGTGIMAYSAKFASAFYGPFRDAAGSAPDPAAGHPPPDRRTHQIDPRNARQALAHADDDAAQGADILMVKPAMAYLDVLAKMRARHDRPIAAYHVSGEYAMLKAAAARGWIDEPRAVAETLTCIKRAGADLIITYYAKDWLAGRY